MAVVVVVVVLVVVTVADVVAVVLFRGTGNKVIRQISEFLNRSPPQKVFRVVALFTLAQKRIEMTTRQEMGARTAWEL